MKTANCAGECIPYTEADGDKEIIKIKITDKTDQTKSNN